MSTDKSKSLLDVALDVRKEHQESLEKKTAEKDLTDSAETPGNEPIDSTKDI